MNYFLVKVTELVKTSLQDPYGHYKLACEEALAHYRTKEGDFLRF